MSAGNRLAVLITATLLVMSAHAQQPASVRQTATFTAPDGAFHFGYPADFQVCTKEDIEPCRRFAYIPICDWQTLACVLYPHERFQNTSFEEAAFQVREILRDGKSPETADECVTPDKGEYLISAEHPVEVIGGISFLHGWDVEGPLMGNVNHIEIYRAFHNGRCFEACITEAEANPDMSDPPLNTLTPVQQKELQQTMADILHSLRFNK